MNKFSLTVAILLLSIASAQANSQIGNDVFVLAKQECKQLKSTFLKKLCKDALIEAKTNDALVADAGQAMKNQKTKKGLQNLKAVIQAK